MERDASRLRAPPGGQPACGVPSRGHKTRPHNRQGLAGHKTRPHNRQGLIDDRCDLTTASVDPTGQQLIMAGWDNGTCPKGTCPKCPRITRPFALGTFLDLSRTCPRMSHLLNHTTTQPTRSTLPCDSIRTFARPQDTTSQPLPSIRTFARPQDTTSQPAAF